jgi:hypothetical protein
MVKAVLLESQSPVAEMLARRKKCLGSFRAVIAAANPVPQSFDGTEAPSQRWTLANEVK